MARLHVSVALAALLFRSADAFVATSGGVSVGSVTNSKRQVSAESRTRLSLATPEESARALSDYMAKSHEEKLKAVKDVEDKKNAEIQALKNEVASLKSSTGGAVSNASPLANLPEGTTEELATKLQAYQKFMAEYIVKAQEEKVKAIKAAEVAVEKKYEEKLLLLGTGGSAPAPAAAAQLSIPPQTTATPKLFADRNAKVSAAAQAGKSRWGDMENQRAGEVASSLSVGGSAVNGAAVAAAASVPVPVPPEVEAADHGLRADGGVGGLTLAERVAFGAAGGAGAASVAVASAPAPAAVTLYDRRNAMVAAAANAGKSRWGEMEIQKSVDLAGRALSGSAAPAPATGVVQASPEVVAADHGLRADGGVSGPSLAERVNLGARLLQNA